MHRTGHVNRVRAVALAVLLNAGHLTGAAAGASTTDNAARLPAPEAVGNLSVGDTLFWDGDLHVEAVRGTNLVYGHLAFGETPDEAARVVDAADMCGQTEPCWAYEIDVAETADRLRVFMDVNKRSECVWLELWAPGTYGDPDATRSKVVASCNELYPVLFPMFWDMEVVVDDPAPGAWVARVVPFLVDEGWGFRLRATLEREEQTGQRALLPDLTALPPHDFGFAAPVNPAAGVVSDKQNPAGPSQISCTYDEIVEAHLHGAPIPVRCLRFSAGIYNVGEGLLHLDLLEGGQVSQRIRRGDGTTVKEREAGTWEDGGTHLHSHLAGFADFELYRVLDQPSHPDPNEERYLELAGEGHKLGWNDADQRLYDWSRFDRWVQLTEFLKCRGGDGCIVVSPGWGDHYRWSRPGMYVDFPPGIAGSADGDYLVRMIIDRNDHIAESDESNNVSYAWIQVSGDAVTICERGIGNSPWDPRRELHEPLFWLGTPGGTSADSPTGICS